MSSKDIVIVGGYGGMGQLFARLFVAEGHSVTITGPTHAKGKKVAAELGVNYCKSNTQAAADADVVIISVPIDKTLDAITEVAPALKAGSLMMDLTSIKQKPCEYMSKHTKKGVEVIGAHPIFGPRVRGIAGQVFVLTPVKGTKWLPKVKMFLQEHKAKVYESTPAEHDRIMAVVQGLTHFSYISLGKTLQTLDFDIKHSRDFSSPVYNLMLDMVGRIIGQDPKLYAEIQMGNPHVGQVHDAFMEAASELKEMVAQGDEEGFIRRMVEAAKHFDDVEQAMGRSDKAIASQVAELEALKESVGQERCLRHIYSGAQHLGVVKEVTPEEVVLVDNGRQSRLKLSNVRLVCEKEALRFRRERYGSLFRDYSVVFEVGVEEALVADLLVEHDDGVYAVEVKDVYTGTQVPDGKKSVCFRVELLNRNPKEIDGRVNTFLEKIGGVRR